MTQPARTLTDADVDTLAAALAALRDQLSSLVVYIEASATAKNWTPTGDEGRTLARLAKPLRAALADTAAAAEAHDAWVADLEWRRIATSSRTVPLALWERR